MTTFEQTYPRIVHSEGMTHRQLARNSGSTRAITLTAQVENLIRTPFIPERFGINQPGMQAYRHLVGLKHEEAVRIWLAGRDRALTTALELQLGVDVMADLFQYDPARGYVSGERMLDKLDQIKKMLPKSTDTDLVETSMLSVHKQLAGRGLEAYMWHTMIMTTTELSNYFALRVHPDAQGEIATIARMTKEVYETSTPRELTVGQWHLPLVEEGEFEDVWDAIRASAARCAAVSYNRHTAKNFEREVGRYNDLRSGGHMSPLEHQATPFSDAEMTTRTRMATLARVSGEEVGLSRLQIDQLVTSTEFCGNFRGWRQHRKDIEGEDDFSLVQH